MKRKLLGIVGVVLTPIGMVVASLGTMYECLPSEFRYSALIGIFISIYGINLIGAASEYPDDDILS